MKKSKKQTKKANSTGDGVPYTVLINEEEATAEDIKEEKRFTAPVDGIYRFTGIPFPKRMKKGESIELDKYLNRKNKS